MCDFDDIKMHGARINILKKNHIDISFFIKKYIFTYISRVSVESNVQSQ